MKYTPRHDFVLVQAHKPEEITNGGILLPETAREDKRDAVILDIGPGRDTDFGHFLKMEGLNIGDTIVFNPFTGYELDKQERLFLVRNCDIVCVISDDK